MLLTPLAEPAGTSPEGMLTECLVHESKSHCPISQGGPRCSFCIGSRAGSTVRRKGFAMNPADLDCGQGLLYSLAGDCGKPFASLSRDVLSSDGSSAVPFAWRYRRIWEVRAHSMYPQSVHCTCPPRGLLISGKSASHPLSGESSREGGDTPLPQQGMALAG